MSRSNIKNITTFYLGTLQPNNIGYLYKDKKNSYFSTLISLFTIHF